MDAILAAILENNLALVKRLIRQQPALVNRRVETATLYESSIFHWLYVGDCALHLAAAGYRLEIVNALISSGADPNSAFNHRRGAPLHYAADGCINDPAWNPIRQIETIRCLLDAGAEIDLQDKNGATPLHRAVRTRCAAAVKYLLNAGSDPQIRNKPGSTAFHLAVQNTGRGGSGTPEAIAAQRQIIEAFRAHRVSPALKDGKGKTVFECAWSGNVIEWLS